MTACRRGVLFACAVLALVPFAACSKDKKPSVTPASSSSAAPTTTSTSTTTTSTLPAVCDAPPVPASAVRTSEAQGDFNGDQSSDTLTVYGAGTADQPGPFHVHIELGNSAGRVDAGISGADLTGSTNVEALGAADISASAGLPSDGSGEEAFVSLGAGASASLVTVFQLIGCNLTQLTDPQGQPSSFAIGGSVTHQGGLRCDGTTGGVRLVQLSATSDDGITYNTTDARLEIQAGKFTVTNTVNGTASANDLQPYSTLDCAGVKSPGS